MAIVYLKGATAVDQYVQKLEKTVRSEQEVSKPYMVIFKVEYFENFRTPCFAGCY